MIDACPNIQCSSYNLNSNVVRDGSYYRQDDSRRIHRFKCRTCLKRFSSSTKTLEWRQKKRRVNQLIFEILASGVSMRRSAKIARVNRRTIDRKLIYLAQKARMGHQQFIQQLKNSPITHVQFDDLISSIHTKLKPVSISIVVDKNSRCILGAEVSIIPAFGKLAELSRRKYGTRKSEHLVNLHSLFSKIQESISPLATFETDEHKFYPIIVRKYFPHAEYKQYKGAKSTGAGLGELKKQRFDPLFKINHTCAMFRANINRLIRRTWCTSKNIDRLRDHIDLFIYYQNSILLK